MTINTLYLRLEGPMQAWGTHQSKFVVRRTGSAPTKSAVIGMLCAALGIPRAEASVEWLPRLAALTMGVRIDRAGIRWWDYHTVGAKMQMRTAKGEFKSGAMLTRREYLCDASFLVVLQGEPPLISELSDALAAPCWPIYLGRKSCPPSRPLLEYKGVDHPDMLTALKAIPWRKRCKRDAAPQTLDYLCDWRPSASQTEAPADAEIWYDVPVSFDPPAHEARFVIGGLLHVGENGDVAFESQPVQRHTPAPPRPRANYGNSAYRKARSERLNHDHHLCVFCKSLATTVQHITYRRAGGDETHDDLRSLCRLCHDAVTMLEYGLGMGLDRINPEDPQWRDKIIKKRRVIIMFRSIQTRRRRLAAEEVE